MKIGKWTIVPEDKIIIKQYGNGATFGYYVLDENFWANNVSNDIRAIQFTGDDNDFNQVEFNDGKDHDKYSGNIQIFINEWDKLHLLRLQKDWDNNKIRDPQTNEIILETETEKINRLGPRPTTFVSTDSN